MIANPAPAAATASILIWPIDPVIASDRGGTALWLENRGATEAVMQIRIMRWTQSSGADSYTRQDAVAASPPIARIGPGVRQLVRLIAAPDQRSMGEGAYRILVDEIPVAGSGGNAAADQGTMIRFRMRYSVPLFVYGKGADRKAMPAASRTALSCSMLRDSEGRFVRVRNTGDAHARLTRAAFGNGTASTPLTAGLLGYVLPGSAMKWPLPKGAPATGVLQASVNGGSAQVSIGPCAVE